MRSAIVMGLHLNVPETQLSDPNAREHRKRLFWTTYMFDRMWAAKLSQPAAVRDDEIEEGLPSDPGMTSRGTSSPVPDEYADAAYQIASIKLVAILTDVIRSIYGLRKQIQEANLSTRVHHSLKDLQAWVDQLPPRLQIDHSPDGSNDLRIVSLYLFYYQVSPRPPNQHTAYLLLLRHANHVCNLSASSWPPARSCFTLYESKSTQALQQQHPKSLLVLRRYRKPAPDVHVSRCDSSRSPGSMAPS